MYALLLKKEPFSEKSKSVFPITIKKVNGARHKNFFLFLPDFAKDFVCVTYVTNLQTLNALLVFLRSFKLSFLISHNLFLKFRRKITEYLREFEQIKG